MFDGCLFLFELMSEVVGCMVIQVGVCCFECEMGGKGILFGGVLGVGCVNVVIIGGGMVGINVVKMVVGMGVQVLIFDINVNCFCYFDDIFGNCIQMVYLNQEMIFCEVVFVDFVVGVVFVFGVKVLYFVMCEYLCLMDDGLVVVDVVVD